MLHLRNLKQELGFLFYNEQILQKNQKTEVPLKTKLLTFLAGQSEEAVSAHTNESIDIHVKTSSSVITW